MDPVGKPEISLNISFGFNNPNFSDRILLLEIIDHDRHHKGTTTPPLHVKTIYISSLILASRSHFFLKLFSNSMLESENKHVTLQIEASEKVPFMDLLKYVYCNDLPTTSNALLDLLVIADKFEVESCLRECSQSLQNLPMTCESASLYLDLPPTLLNSPTVHPLIEMVKDFLVKRFKAERVADATKAKKAASESEDDSFEESEDEEPQKKKIKGQAVAKESSSSEESSEGGSSEEENEKPSKTLFVGNLSFSVKQADVKNFFKSAGEIVDVRLSMKYGEFRGFGHVEFATEEAAEKALRELNGGYLLGRAVRLDLARERTFSTGGKDTPSFFDDTVGI